MKVKSVVDILLAIELRFFPKALNSDIPSLRPKTQTAWNKFRLTQLLHTEIMHGSCGQTQREP